MPPSFVASITTTLILLPFLLVGTFSAIANSNGMLERTEEESPSLVPRSSLSDFSDNSKNSSNHHHRKRHYNHQRHRNTGDEKPVAMWHDHLNEIRNEDEQEEERQQSDDPSVSTGISGTPQSFFVSNANITKGQRYFNFFFRNATTTTTTMTEWKIVSTKSELSETEDGGDYDDLVSRVTSTIPQIYDDKQPDSNEQGDVVVSSSSPPQPIITVTTVFLVFLFSVLLILTVIGNSLVCLSLIFVKKLRKPQNYLIASLAVSDLFVAVFVMPVAIVLEVYEGQWPFNGELCDFWVSGKQKMCIYCLVRK